MKNLIFLLVIFSSVINSWADDCPSGTTANELAQNYYLKVELLKRQEIVAGMNVNADESKDHIKVLSTWDVGSDKSKSSVILNQGDIFRLKASNGIELNHSRIKFSIDSYQNFSVTLTPFAREYDIVNIAGTANLKLQCFPKVIFEEPKIINSENGNVISQVCLGEGCKEFYFGFKKTDGDKSIRISQWFDSTAEFSAATSLLSKSNKAKITQKIIPGEIGPEMRDIQTASTPRDVNSIEFQKFYNYISSHLK